MKLIQKLKTTKGKWIIAIAVLIIFFIGSGGMSNQAAFASESTCSAKNDIAGYITTETSYNLCDNYPGCTVAYKYNPVQFGSLTALGYSPFQFLLKVINLHADAAICISGADSGQYLLEDDKTSANNDCKSGYATQVGSLIFGKKVFECTEPPEGYACSNDFLGKLGSFVKSAGLPIEQCSLAGILGIAIMAVFLILLISMI